jgi:hypothetical protein
MISLLQQIPIDRALLVIFVAGQLYERFKSARVSLRDQGKRIGALETRVTALEASGKRG